MAIVGAALGEDVFNRTRGMVAPPGNRVGIGIERDRQGSVTLAFVDFKANRRPIPSPHQNRDTARDNKRLDALPQRVKQLCYHKYGHDYCELGRLLFAGEQANGARINMIRRVAVARKMLTSSC